LRIILAINNHLKGSNVNKGVSIYTSELNLKLNIYINKYIRKA